MISNKLICTSLFCNNITYCKKYLVLRPPVVKKNESVNATT